MNMDKTASGSMPGCKVTGCLDGLIGGSNLSTAEFNNDNSGSNATGASGSNATGASGSNATGASVSNATGASGSNATGASGSNATGAPVDELRRRALPRRLPALPASVSNATGASGSTIQKTKNYEEFPLVVGWDGTSGMALPGTESSGCKNNMNIDSSMELCNGSPECDGFFAYTRNDSDRVCFKKNVDTSKNVKKANQNWISNNNAQNSKFFVKEDRVNSNNPPEPFSNIEEVHGNKGITIDNNVFGNVMTTLLFIILTYYLCKKLKLF